MKKKTLFFFIITLPFLNLMAQKGDYVFDPKKLLPTTLAQIDSTAAHIYTLGMTDKSNIGLFMESIYHIGTITRGTDLAIIEYCTSIDSIASSVRKNKLEEILHRNINFLKNHTLHSSENDTWHITTDSISLLPHRNGISYMIHTGAISHRHHTDSITFRKIKGIYSPYDGNIHIHSAHLSYPRHIKDSIYFHIENGSLTPHTSSFISSFCHISIPSYSIKNLEGEFTYTISQKKIKPTFTSHDTNITLSDSTGIFSITGTLHTQGHNIHMYAHEDIHTRMMIKTKENLFATISSQKIVVGDTIIRIPSSTATLYIGTDSVTHPCVLSSYDRHLSLLTLYQTEEKLSSAPFFNSYSALKLYAKAVQADCKNRDIWFVFDARTAPQVISDKYFEPEIYRHFRGVGTYNPLPDILTACQNSGVLHTPIEDIAHAIHSSTETAILIAMEITRLGYGYYDHISRTLTLYQGFEHMILSARGHSDYDGIAYYGNNDKDIIAHMDSSTGHINLSNMKMVKLSPAGDIFLSPDSTGVKAEKGGNFSYGGSVTLGLFTIAGTAAFDYDLNSITLQGYSRMSFKIPTATPHVFIPIINTIDSLRGSITLNTPSNKSSRGKNLRYPMLSTVEKSYIFYPHLDSLYGKENLYITIEPFTIDSLSSRNTQGIRFDGTLHTGEIVPPFKREIRVLPDHTLGFEQADFSHGVTFYNKGMYHGSLNLDKKGLTGSGIYTYHSTEITSDSIRMLPLQVFSQGTASIAQSTTYDTPRAVFTPSYIIWDTAHDTLSIRTDSLYGWIFNPAIHFIGTIYITPTTMSGNGTILSSTFTLTSNDIAFHHDYLSSPLSNITLGTEKEPHKISMLEVKTTINPSSHIGEFYMTSPYTITHITALNSSIKMPLAHWDMDRNLIHFSSKDTSGTITLFTDNPDSLTLTTHAALYDLTTDTMMINDIDSFIIGDAIIIPPHNTLSIDTTGKIKPFTMGEIILDTSTMYHRLYDAHIEIFSGQQLTGSATYDYTDPDGITYPMHFTDISADTMGHIVAAANTYISKDYELGAYFRFRGQSTLKGHIKGLGLRGEVYPIKSICPHITTGSIKIDAPVGDTLLLRPTIEVINGIYTTSTGFNGAFMYHHNDTYKNLLTALDGDITHDDYIGAYIVGDTSSYPLYHYYHDECRITTRGTIYINDPSGHMRSIAAGELEYDMNDGSISGKDISIALDIDIPSTLQENLSILASQMSLTGITRTTSASWEYISPSTHTHNSTISLSGIALSSHPDTPHTLTYIGEIPLHSLCGIPMESRIKSLITLIKSPTGADEINIYLHDDSDKEFIFLRYKNGTAYFLCSDPQIMKTFDTAVEKYRDATPEEYILRRATKTRIEDFKSSFK